MGRRAYRGYDVLYQLPFDSEDDPRWRLLDAARDRLAMARDQDDVIAIVRGAARNIVSADGVSFVLREYGHCHYVEEDAISPLWKGQKFPMTSCISGWAMLHDMTAVVPDIFADDRIPHDVYRKTFVRSLVMTPVSIDTPVAAIGAYWQERKAITPREVAAVEVLAELVGAALRRTQKAA